MSHQCPILIEFTPRGGAAVALVPAGGWLSSLPVFQAAQQLYEADGVLTSEGFFRPLGGATVSFNLEIEVEDANHLSAQTAILSGDVAISGALAFVADTWRCDFSHAAILALDPGLPSGTPEPIRIRALQVTCGLPVFS